MFSNHRAPVSEENSRGTQARAGGRWFLDQGEAHPKIVAALTLMIAAIPAFFAARWVYRYGVDVPWKDDWDSAPLVIKAHMGQLTWSDLFHQQQEARYVLPKLIFIASSWAGHWDVRRMMIASVVVCVLTALGLFWLLGKTGLNGLTRAVCFWLIALLIFSAAQYELWPWASGLPSFLPAFFLVAALCGLEAEFSTPTKFILCATLTFAASFTLPHGLLLWALTFPLLLLRGGLSNCLRWLCAWGVAAAVCAAIYFHGYVRPAQVPEFAPAISFLVYAQYFLAFLGGGLAYAVKDHRVTVAAIAGFVLLALYLGVLAFAVRRKDEPALLRRLLPWFALGAYAISSAVLATLGRVGFGLESAISSRYVAFSLYLSIAVVVLIATIGKEIGRRRRGPVLPAAFYATCLLLGGAFLTLDAFASARSVRLMESAAAKTRQGKAALLFSRVLETSAMVSPLLYFDRSWVRENADALDKMKLLHPPLLRSKSMSQLPHREADDEEVLAKWERRVSAPNESYNATGWVILNRKGRPADAVVLAYETVGEETTVFVLADQVTFRGNAVHDKRVPRKCSSGWEANLPPNAVPANAHISAWALDAETPMLYRLKEGSEAVRQR